MIVFAGESAGALLASSLIQMILALQQAQQSSTPTVRFNGSNIILPRPAGVTCLSPGLDLSLSLPSHINYAENDLVATRIPYLDAGFPTCEIWPLRPPREHHLCPAKFLAHPLVSPCTAKSWKGSPPLWFALGSKEAIVDGARIVAMTAAKEGVPVYWMDYLVMPHIWPIYFPKWWQSNHVLERWALACLNMLGERPIGGQSKGISVQLDETERPVDITALTQLTPEHASKIIERAAKDMSLFLGNYRQ